MTTQKKRTITFGETPPKHVKNQKKIDIIIVLMKKMQKIKNQTKEFMNVNSEKT